MIRYTVKFGGYFVDHFRNSPKIKSRQLQPRDNPTRRISVVTTCMNRFNDICLTLPKNINDNYDYPSEFVLLDYCSTDGLEEWVRTYMMDHIATGKLVYYKVLGHVHFHHNHSRNMSFRLAKEEIITNVDSDNYIHKGFLERVNQCADDRVLVVPESFLKPNTNKLFLRGRFAVMRKDLYELGGFDEDLDGYGYDDVSFVCRAMLNGFWLSRYEDKFLNHRIPTTVKDMVRNTQNHDRNADKIKNMKITAEKLSRGVIRANHGRGWGEGIVVKNFNEVITLTGVPSI